MRESEYFAVSRVLLAALAVLAVLFCWSGATGWRDPDWLPSRQHQGEQVRGWNERPPAGEAT
jgi:hypothetical protein